MEPNWAPDVINRLVFIDARFALKQQDHSNSVETQLPQKGARGLILMNCSLRTLRAPGSFDALCVYNS
jgi:hypothetical protein